VTARNVVIRMLSPERGYSVARLYLGVALLVRGVLLWSDPQFGGDLIGARGATAVVPRLFALTHAIGGALLALGLLTRLAAAVQILPVLGALVGVHAGGKLAGADQSLELVSLVLVMLVCFACFGGGDWSLDARLNPPHASARRKTSARHAARRAERFRPETPRRPDAPR
jgi:uncharacterized membrane protein YphA (DoxX/SURF4 family)